MSFKQALLESIESDINDALREQLTDFVEDLEWSYLVALWNDYAIDSNYSDDVVYENDEDFFENNFKSPYEAVSAWYRGDYKFGDRYVKFNGYANLNSYDDINDVVDKESLIDWLVENVERAEDYGFDFEEPEVEDEE